MSRYTYGDLDRLLTASVPAGESFAYDTIGNMTTKSGATLDYGTTAPKHAVKSHGTTTYTYDANGSMTARGTQTIKYDPEQRPIRIQDGETIYRVAYDGDGVRRKRLDENGTIHYLGHYERNVGNGSDTTEVVTKYYYASLGATSRLIAFRRAGTLYWAGTDHLGGTIRVMDSSFAPVDGMRYESYGEDRDTGSSLNTDRKFTGQTEDESVGLYWYQSRAYDPEIGRFVSPDVVVPEPGNPQALNRYSYVYNNPLKFVDPSGHSAEWFNQQWRDDFWDDHKRQPTGLDIAYRYASMDATSRGQDWSVEHWASQLPPVPAAPEGVDINANILYTESTLMLGLVSSVTGNPLSMLTPYADWFNRIREGGKWDYKRINLEKFEEFGNFNFGATGAALGIPEEVLLKGAASVQILDLRASGEGNFSLLPGGGVAPYGDERKDAAAIKAGIAYYHAHRARRAIQFTEDALSVVKGAYSGIRSLFTPSR